MTRGYVPQCTTEFHFTIYFNAVVGHRATLQAATVRESAGSQVDADVNTNTSAISRQTGNQLSLCWWRGRRSISWLSKQDWSADKNTHLLHFTASLPGNMKVLKRQFLTIYHNCRVMVWRNGSLTVLLFIRCYR